MHREISKDKNVHIISRRFTAWAARLLIISPIIVFFLIFIIICNSFINVMIKLIVDVIFIANFITILFVLIKTKTIELIVTGATWISRFYNAVWKLKIDMLWNHRYTTILIVFISSPNLLTNWIKLHMIMQNYDKMIIW